MPDPETPIERPSSPHHRPAGAPVPRASALGSRAESHIARSARPDPLRWPATAAVVLVALVTPVVGLGLLASCGPETAGAAGAAASAAAPDAGQPSVASLSDEELFPEREGAMALSPEAQAAIRELMEALEPIEDTVTSDVTDEWFIRHNKLVGDLVEADREIGVAALTAYSTYEGGATDVNRGLLTVAAHAAPDDSRELLKTLMLEYGFPMDDRTVALRLLAETSPEVFLENAERFLRRRGIPHETAPNDEFFIRGWVVACDKVGRSPVEVLADVVTNLAMEPAARHYAAEALGRYPDPVGRAALETAMIESTGNHYLRRKAAQALRESIPREDACDLFLHVMNHETDYNFQVFLRSMIEAHCR